jgi:hypothetical protein
MSPRSTDGFPVAERSSPQNNINGRCKLREAQMAEWEKQIFAINLIVGDL